MEELREFGPECAIETLLPTLARRADQVSLQRVRAPPRHPSLATLPMFAARSPAGEVLGKIITDAQILITDKTRMAKKAVVMFYGMLL